jgi:hypothetical protein
MAWYPGATKYELPESDSQPAIKPTQFIVHSIIAPWTAKRTYEYWRDSTSLESHFGLGYAGDLGQFIGTETRADANYLANRRPDGTGAVSIETASNTKGTDPWTVEQIEQLIRLGVWLHQRHGIPLRICRTGSDPGYGYHRLHPEWSPSGTACPGDARVKQFRDVVFPGIVARATSQPNPPEEDMTPDESRMLKSVYERLNVAPWTYKGAAQPTRDAFNFLVTTDGNAAKTVAGLVTLTAKVDALTAANKALVDTVARLAADVGDLDPAAIVAELTAALESVQVRLDVPDTTPTP